MELCTKIAVSLSDYQLDSLTLTPSAREYIVEALASDEFERPVSKRSGSRGVEGLFSSVARNQHIPYDNRGGHLAQLLRWEIDKNVLLIRYRPPGISLRRPVKSVGFRQYTYRPDYLVLTSSAATVFRIRTRRNLRQLRDKQPTYWLRKKGDWVDVQATQAFEKVGITHQVVDLSTLNKIKSSNLKTVLQCSRSEIQPIDSVRETVLTLLDEHAWLSLKELKESANLPDYSVLHSMIAQREIHIDWGKCLLTQPESCFISREPDVLKLMYDGSISSPVESGETLSQCQVPSLKGLQHAQQRLEVIERGESKRQIRRLMGIVRNGSENGLSPLLSLIPKKGGNPTDRLEQCVRDEVDRHISEFYCVPEKPTLAAAYQDYLIDARRAHADHLPVSKKTYRIALEARSPRQVAYARGGRRAANAHTLGSEVSVREVTAQRALERACIDHVQTDVFAVVVESNGKKFATRPYLSVLTDEFSGMWLAFWLSFDAPSRRALGMLIRQCVKSFGRLPECVHSDQGSDLRSHYYRDTLSAFGCSYDWSPAAHSRFNGQVEGFFSRLQQQWSVNRPGNVVDFDEPRSVSRGYHPQKLAALSLGDMFIELAEFQDHYNDTVLGNKTAPPLTRFNQSLLDYPYSGIPIKYDKPFIIQTAIPDSCSKRAISPNGDIIRNGIRFVNSKLYAYRAKHKRVETRLDPENPYRMYCLLDSDWIVVEGGGAGTFSVRSEIDRWSEAVTVGEGRRALDAAKEDANQILAEKRKKTDSQRKKKERRAKVVKNKGSADAAQSLDDNFSFQALREGSIEALETSPKVIKVGINGD